MPSRKKASTTSRGARPVGEVVGELMAQTGFARVQAGASLERAWRDAVGESAAQYTRPGRIRRGVLEVGVANSTMVQELVFQKIELLVSLRRLLPDTRINDLHFSVVPIEET
ncbi:MAG TPA: DUF721 domain-containing protein [Thermoguttaceae bacterium]|nr:DUF721 domain-containing protein [Thermoguttaceae bacterium]